MEDESVPVIAVDDYSVLVPYVLWQFHGYKIIKWMEDAIGRDVSFRPVKAYTNETYELDVIITADVPLRDIIPKFDIEFRTWAKLTFGETL